MTKSCRANSDDIAHFDSLSDEWWNLDGPLKTLHWMNPARLEYITNRIKNLEGLSALDVGCGGGILSEPLARLGANVTGIDAAERAIETAKHHAEISGLKINYQCQTLKQHLGSGQAESYDAVFLLELIEHVDDPEDLISQAVSALKPGGSIFISTINRTPLSYLTTIVAAENLFNLVPKGTHDWNKFLTPHQIYTMLEAHDAEVQNISGFAFNPLTKSFSLKKSPGSNHIMHATKRS